MKRFFFILLALMMICALLYPVTSYADDTVYSYGFMLYRIEDGGIIVCGYVGDEETELYIPNSLGGYPVSVIETGAFEDAPDLQVLYLPDTIMEIQEGAIPARIEVVRDYNLSPEEVYSEIETTSQFEAEWSGSGTEVPFGEIDSPQVATSQPAATQTSTTPSEKSAESTDQGNIQGVHMREDESENYSTTVITLSQDDKREVTEVVDVFDEKFEVRAENAEAIRTAEIKATPAPTASARPTATPAPTASARPTETPMPTASARPTDTTKPTATPAPTETTESASTTETTDSTTTSSAQESSTSTKPTATAKPTASAKPTATPAPTESTKPTATLKPSESAKPTAAPAPTESAKPAESAKPTATPAPTESAKPTAASVPAESAKPTATPKPSESPASADTNSSGSAAGIVIAALIVCGCAAYFLTKKKKDSNGK